MLSKSDIIERLVNPGVVAVVRALRRDQVLPLSQALIAGGITAIEITLTTPDAFAAIQEARDALADRALIGVGTILKPYDCQQALEAGAQYVVTPICRPELVALAHHANKPIMLGAYSPTEAQTAHEAGADFIKIFPADGLGPNYIKALRAPLPHLKIVPTGGVDSTEASLKAWFDAGVVCVGMGSNLVTSELLKAADYPGITAKVKATLDIIQAIRGGK